MKPKHFVTLAIVALVSVALALTSYAANNTWTPGRVTGARMFPALASNAGNVAAIELRQGTKQLTIEIPGEQPLKVERGADKKLAVLGIPPGLKLKDDGAGDAIARAAAYVDFDDVRKLPPVSPKDASTDKLEAENGLTVNMRLRKDGDAQWLTVTATGEEGDAKKAADDITARSS